MRTVYEDDFTYRSLKRGIYAAEHALALLQPSNCGFKSAYEAESSMWHAAELSRNHAFSSQ